MNLSSRKGNKPDTTDSPYAAEYCHGHQLSGHNVIVKFNPVYHYWTKGLHHYSVKKLKFKGLWTVSAFLESSSNSHESFKGKSIRLQIPQPQVSLLLTLNAHFTLSMEIDQTGGPSHYISTSGSTTRTPSPTSNSKIRN